MGKVVSMRRGEQFDVRIDRATQWGNPFRAKDRSEGERRRVVEEYRVWLWNEIRRGRWTLAELSELSDKRLGCWCAPELCHGDVLLRAAQWAQNKMHEPVATYLSTERMTVLVESEAGVITNAPPIVRKFVGQRLSALERWMRKQPGFKREETS